MQFIQKGEKKKLLQTLDGEKENNYDEENTHTLYTELLSIYLLLR